MSNLLTDDERKVVALAGELADLLSRIVGDDSTQWLTDLAELVPHTNVLQNAILARAYPDTCCAMGESFRDPDEDRSPLVAATAINLSPAEIKVFAENMARAVRRIGQGRQQRRSTRDEARTRDDSAAPGMHYRVDLVVDVPLSEAQTPKQARELARDLVREGLAGRARLA